MPESVWIADGQYDVTDRHITSFRYADGGEIGQVNFENGEIRLRITSDHRGGCRTPVCQQNLNRISPKSCIKQVQG